MALFARRLQCVGYPNATSFDPNSDEHLRALVCWLENKVIRLYEVDSRSAITAPLSPAWFVSFSQYLSELKCPLVQGPAMNAVDKKAIIGWLLSHAVSLLFGDSVSSGSLKFSEAPSTTTITPEDNSWHSKLSELCGLLNIPFPAGDQERLLLLEALSKVLETKFSPNSIQQAIDEGTVNTPKATNLSELPHGIAEVPNDKMGNAAIILRLLHNQDLRQLQTQINEIIVEAQNLTANPKTNTKLGLVGF
ncbi:RNA transcription, translation and transport factor protein [Pelomyxa schiedti]|nr:RNA transcription, translation and transport factor protein [Pelomyxa schiedti]